MYDKFYRNTSNHLQDDLRSEMKTYAYEKDRLAHHLACLNQPELTSTTLSTGSPSLEVSSPSNSTRKNQYYRAPNLVAATPGPGSQTSDASSNQSNARTIIEQKRKERKEMVDKLKKEKDLLKLPVIHSASTKRSEWESGKHLSSKQTTVSGLDPLPGIFAAKELLLESMKIPTIHDPTRTDTLFETSRGKKSSKKVTFAEDKDGLLLSVNQIEAYEGDGSSQHSKNLKSGNVPKLNLTANQFSHVAKPRRPKKTSLLPPLQVSPTEVRHHPQRVTDNINKWKTHYSQLINAEEKMQALTDIMYAVRLKKYENEQVMKYGDGPRPIEKDHLVNEMLQSNAIDRVSYRDETGQARPGCIPTPRSNSVSRLGAAHPDQLQLQYYLHKMSHRVLDKIESQRYDQESPRKYDRSSPRKKKIEKAISSNPTPVQVKG